MNVKRVYTPNAGRVKQESIVFRVNPMSLVHALSWSGGVCSEGRGAQRFAPPVAMSVPANEAEASKPSEDDSWPCSCHVPFALENGKCEDDPSAPCCSVIYIYIYFF